VLISYRLVDTSWGLVTLAWSDTGLAYMGFPHRSREQAVTKMKRDVAHLIGAADLRENASGAPHVADWLVSYFAGKLTGADLRPFDRKRGSFLNYAIDPPGTEFQRRVWFENAAVPLGETASYGDLAQRVGTSPRAVGGAMGANRLPIVVPCHRVIGADGSLVGFGGGIPMKARLLALERGIVAKASATAV
jgi:O-6-methylguanine DNA methyltransferase